jgi:pimeloyl-ACP methyl ester carboxylesterase
MKTRLNICVALVTAFVPLASALGAEPAENPFNLRIEPYEFTPVSGEKVDAELGRFTVLENRSKPDGKKLELAFVRFPCTSEECGPPIVYLAGGPGGSGIGTARLNRFPLFMGMREFGDVIAFDQRGTGESEPDLGCGDPYFLPFDKPADRAVAGEIIANVARQCFDRLTEEGHDISAFNTLESADDLNDLRQALGAEKISLWGISYGSHLGLAMLKRHGATIDRAILAGIEPLHHSWKLPSDQQQLLETIAALAKEDPATKAAVPDLLASIRGLLDKLEAEPQTVMLTHPMNGQTVPVTVGRLDFQATLAGMLRGPDEHAGIPDFVHRLENGDWTALALAAGQRRMGEMWNMMSAAMDCASGQSEEWAERIAREAESALLADAINIPYPEVCAGIPVPDLGDDFRAPGKSDVPVLLISGSVDGRTPPGNAEEVLPGLSKGHHLIVEGSGHDVFMSSRKVGEAMATFMRNGSPGIDRIQLEPMEFQKPRSVMALDAELLARYAGNYQITDGEFRRVIQAGNQLYTRRGEGQVLPIRPTSETRFFYEGSSTWLDFVVDADGNVTGMEMHHDGSEEAEPAAKIE